MHTSDLAKRTTLIISNEEVNDIMKIVKSLEDSGLLIKCVSETIKNEAKEQQDWFLRMLLGTLGTPLPGKGVIQAHEGTTRVGQNFSSFN